MMTDEEREHNWDWAKNRVSQSSGLASLVSILNEEGEEVAVGVLSFDQQSLCLEDINGIRFQSSLQDAKNSEFCCCGIHRQLNVEIAHQQYRVALSAFNIEHLLDQYMIGGWFGETLPGMLISLARAMIHRKEMIKANFAEAEKWRDVFPAAEFPDTNPNAKP